MKQEIKSENPVDFYKEKDMFGFDKNDIFEKVKEDLKKGNIPYETKVYFSKTSLFFEMVIIFIFLAFGYGSAMVITAGETWVSLILIIIGGFVIIKYIKKINNNSPQIILNNNGIKCTKHENLGFISWLDIKEFEIDSWGEGPPILYLKFTSNYSEKIGGKKISVNILNLRIENIRMKRLLETYIERCNMKQADKAEVITELLDDSQKLIIEKLDSLEDLITIEHIAIFTSSNRIDKIKVLLNEIATNKKQGLLLLAIYRKKFKKSLINDLENSVSDDNDLKDVLYPFIKLGILTENSPYKLTK